MDIGTYVGSLFSKNISKIIEGSGKDIHSKIDVPRGTFNHPLEPVELWYSITTQMNRI